MPNMGKVLLRWFVYCLVVGGLIYGLLTARAFVGPRPGM
jgi:hypothetical protein